MELHLSGLLGSIHLVRSFGFPISFFKLPNLNRLVAVGLGVM